MAAESPAFACRRHVAERLLPDLEATSELARRLAGIARRGDVIALEGALGCGKTTFARAFIRALAALHGGDESEDIPSPTFTLVQIYERSPAPVWHFDFYRIERPQEVFELGVEEAFEEAISLIEWPEKLGPFLPGERLDLRLVTTADGEARHATLTGYGAWAERLKEVVAED